MIYHHVMPATLRGILEGAISYADILRLADAIFMQELERSGWYLKTAQTTGGISIGRCGR